MSRNVLARLPGTTHPDEVVMYGAHWDAYGRGAPDAEGRTIRPGANDDALGVAGLLEMARAFKKAPAPARSIVFGFWSPRNAACWAPKPMPSTRLSVRQDRRQHHARHPPDRRPSNDVMLVGKGQNSLENDLASAVATQAAS